MFIKLVLFNKKFLKFLLYILGKTGAKQPLQLRVLTGVLKNRTNDGNRFPVPVVFIKKEMEETKSDPIVA